VIGAGEPGTVFRLDRVLGCEPEREGRSALVVWDFGPCPAPAGPDRVKS
jgi:hypothetical protein